MRETKRVLLSRQLWGLLALLLGLNLMLIATRDDHMAGFYGAYAEALPAFEGLDPEEALAQIEAEQKALNSAGTLFMWQSQWRYEKNAQLRSILREQCTELYGEDFEARIESGELDASEAGAMRGWLRREVLQALQDQLTHLRDYPRYLRQVQVNVEQMSALAMFNKPGSFSMRNIEKTGRDFPESVELQLSSDFAVTHLITDEPCGYLLLLYTLYLTVRLLAERKRGLWCLIHGAPEGRGRLALRRAGILLAGVTLGTLVLFGGTLLFTVVKYHGIGALTRNVQSLAVFSDFPWVMPVWVFLLGFFLLKILGMWLVALAIWAILQSINHLPLALAAAAAVLIAEYSLFRFIPDSFKIAFLRYVNLFALVDVPKVSLHYLNLNIFNRPVQGFLLSLGTVPPLLLALLCLNLVLAAKKKPVSRQNSLLRLFDWLRIPFSRAAGRLRLFGQELYKLLWLQKGLLVLLAVAWFAFRSLEAPFPDTELYDPELAGLSAAMEGPITQQTLTELDEKITLYSSWPESEPVLRQLDALEQLREKVTESLDRQDGGWLINQIPVAALLSRNIDNYQRKNGVLLLFALVLLLSGVFSQERQSRMTQLLRGSPRGRGRLWRRKALAALLLTVAVWLIFEAGELRAIRKAYGAIAFAAPLQSFEYFADLPYSVSLGAGVTAYLLLRLLALCTAAGGILFLSANCRQNNTAILLGCGVLVLPACLSLMGVKAFDRLSLVRFLSPLEAGIPTHAACFALGCGMTVLSYLSWKRRKQNS